MTEPAAAERAAFVCPRDHHALTAAAGGLRCAACGTVYPLAGGVPVLINDDNSVFRIADFVARPGYGGAGYGREGDTASGLRRWVRRTVRRLRDAGRGIQHLTLDAAIDQARALRTDAGAGDGLRVLLVGSGGVTCGRPQDVVLHTDVAFAPHVDAIADAHDLPFADSSFDLAAAVAVLEHVADPQRCVAELRRVLRPDGFVYAVTPFLQPVHMGAYDFTRFTLLGHRRLFRDFDTLAAGVAVGVGSVLAWTLGATLESISGRRSWRRIARTLSLLLIAPLRSLDRLLAAPSAADAAGGCFFFGRRRATPVADRDILAEYRGGFAPP